MTRIAFALTAFAFLSAASAAHAAGFDGTWHLTGDVQGNPVNPVCVLAEKEGKLSGTCTGTDGKLMPVTGTVKEKAVSWQYDTVYQGGGITIIYTASLDKEDHITGAIDVEPFAVSGDFTATRDKSDKPALAPKPAQ